MPKLSDIPVVPIPLNKAEWDLLTPGDQAAHWQLFLQPNALEAWPNSDAYKASQYVGTPVEAPADPAQPMQMWRLKPNMNPIGFGSLGVAVDSLGEPKALKITPASGGSNIGNVETQVQPGGTTPPDVTLIALGGAQAANFFAEYGGYFPGNIPQLEWLPYTPQSLVSPNFAGTKWNQFPLAWATPTEANGINWKREYCVGWGSMFGSPFRVVIFKFEDFRRVMPRFGTQAAPAAKVFSDAENASLAQFAMTQLMLAGPTAAAGAKIREASK